MYRFFIIITIALAFTPALAQHKSEVPELTRISPNVTFYAPTEQELEDISDMLGAVYRMYFADNEIQIEVLNLAEVAISLYSKRIAHGETEWYYIVFFNVWDKDDISLPCRPNHPPRPMTEPCYYKKIVPGWRITTKASR